MTTAPLPTEHTEAMLGIYSRLSPGARRRLAGGEEPQQTEEIALYLAASTPAELTWFNQAVAVLSPTPWEPTVSWHRASVGSPRHEEGDDYELDAPVLVQSPGKYD